MTLPTNTALGITLLYEGDAIPVTHLFGIGGEDVETWGDAYTFVAGPLPNGNWLGAQCAEFQEARLQ